MLSFNNAHVSKRKLAFTLCACLLFMGFTDEDYDKLQQNNPEQRVRSKLFPRDKIIRMAGNSIPVKMLEGFFFQLYHTERILERYD